MRYYILKLKSEHPFPIKNWGLFSQFISDNCEYFNFAKNEPTAAACDWKMLSKIKRTDTITGFNSHGFALSDKFQQVLNKYRLPPHRFYTVQVTHKQKIFTNYAWMHLLLLPDKPSPIDFTKTQFFPVHSYGAIDHPAYFENIEDAFFRNQYLKETSEVHLTAAASCYDILHFRGGLGQCFVSETLKNALVDANITGIEIIEAPIWG
jgi:hypothetical protein